MPFLILLRLQAIGFFVCLFKMFKTTFIEIAFTCSSNVVLKISNIKNIFFTSFCPEKFFRNSRKLRTFYRDISRLLTFIFWVTPEDFIQLSFKQILTGYVTVRYSFNWLLWAILNPPAWLTGSLSVSNAIYIGSWSVVTAGVL